MPQQVHRAERTHGVLDLDQAWLLVQRLATFTQQHPVAVAALVGSVLAAGPKRLVRWAGILLPLVVRLRSR